MMQWHKGTQALLPQVDMVMLVHATQGFMMEGPPAVLRMMGSGCFKMLGMDWGLPMDRTEALRTYTMPPMWGWEMVETV